MPTQSGKKSAKGTRKSRSKGSVPLATVQRIQPPSSCARAVEPTEVTRTDGISSSTSKTATSEENVPVTAIHQPATLSSPSLNMSYSPAVTIADSRVTHSLNMSYSPAVTIAHSRANEVNVPYSFQSPSTLAPHVKHSSPFPFTLKFLYNRVQKCQGCQLPFRQPDVTIQPPHDLIVSRLERRPYRNAMGELTTPFKPSNAHYHLELGCILAADSTFIPSSLVIPGSVMCQLTPAHKDKLNSKLGIKI